MVIPSPANGLDGMMSKHFIGPPSRKCFNRRPTSRWATGSLSAMPVALLAVLSSSALAQVFPAAPQDPGALNGVDGAGFVRVRPHSEAGAGGFVDVPGYAACRYVTNGHPVKEQVIDVSTVTAWMRWRSRPGPGDTQTVCCRPSTPNAADFCGAGGTVGPLNPAVLDYTILGNSITVTTHCTQSCPDNVTDCSYDSQFTYVCGQTGVGVNTDGQWGAGGGGGACAPNSLTSTSAYNCPSGGVATAAFQNDYTCPAGSWSGWYKVSDTCPAAAGTTTYTASCVPQKCGPGNDWACDCDFKPVAAGPGSFAVNYLQKNWNPWSVAPAWAIDGTTLSASAFADVPHGAPGGGGLAPPAGEVCGAFVPDQGIVMPNGGDPATTPCNSDWGGTCSPIHGTIQCSP